MKRVFLSFSYPFDVCFLLFILWISFSGICFMFNSRFNMSVGGGEFEILSPSLTGIRFVIFKCYAFE